MLKGEISILINASAEDVFGYVSDVGRHPDWAANPLEIRHVAGPESGVGATFAATARRTVGFGGPFEGKFAS
jgi:hypothetical protein